MITRKILNIRLLINALYVNLMKNIIMKTVKFFYKDESFEVQITRIRAYPYDVLKINFNSPELLTVIDSPVFITEKPDRLSFPMVQYNYQRDLLMSFGELI